MQIWRRTTSDPEPSIAGAEEFPPAGGAGLRPVEQRAGREREEAVGQVFEVLELIGQGYSTGEVARVLNLSTKTVNTYREHIKEKLSMQGAGELRRFAVKWVQSKS